MWKKVNKEDKGRWNEFVNTQTGESSIKEHVLRTVWKGCSKGEHDFELTGNREVTCTKCGYGRDFILGIEMFKDGKVVPIDHSPTPKDVG